MAEKKKTPAPKPKAGARKPSKAKASAARKPAAATRAATKKVALPAAPGVTQDSPLDGRPGAGIETVVMVEHPHLGKINLRGDPGDKAFLDAVAGAVGTAPPNAANTVAMDGDGAICWLGPDEWLVVTPPDTQGATEAALNAALAGQHVSVVDTTDARTTIRIHGAHARETLSKGCPLDLHPRVFGPGQCAQTLIAKAGVLIHQRDDTPTYDVHVLCSFSRYLWDWLADAAKEFG